jgi:hypothetical protein
VLKLTVLVCFAALSIVWTWPVGAFLASRIPHDPGDPILNTYLLWWNATALPFSPGWWDPPFFFPLRGALALSEHLAGLAIISTPVQLLGGGPVLAYNISLLASYTLSAWFAYLLVLRLTKSQPAAICAGLAYGFAPFRAAQLGHLQVLASQWLPLQLLAMHAYLGEGRRRWLVVVGIAWLLQGLSNGYYLLFAPVLFALWFFWFPRWRSQPGRGLTLAGTWMASSLPFIPILLKYREVHQALGLTRGMAEILDLSATPSSFLHPPRMLAFWAPRTAYAQEDDLFPGLTIVIVIAASVVAGLARGGWRSAVRLRSPFAFYVAAALVMAALAMGPGDPDAGASRWLRPYFWLTFLPGFDSLRVPARFAMLFALCMGVAVGFAVQHLMPIRHATRLLFAVVVAAGISLDGWMDPMPLIAAPGRQFLGEVPGEAVILELPVDDRAVNLTAMYRALGHRRPLVNGHSGYVPPHYWILMQAIRGGDPSPLVELARSRPLVVVVNDRLDPSRELRNLVESVPGITRAASGNAATTYLLSAQPRRRVDPAGPALQPVATALPRSHTLLDFGRAQTVRTIEFPLRENYSSFPRIGIEASMDGSAWAVVWEDWLGGLALAGALDDPQLVPIRIALPDVGARYLRIHPTPDWLMRDLRILGP